MRRRTAEKEWKKLWDEDFEKIRLSKSKKRTEFVRIIIFFCFFVISVKLAFLMVVNREMLSERAERQYLKVETLKAQRGLIWDREMRPMVVNIEAGSLYAVPAKINDIDGFSRRLSRYIDMSAEKINKKVSAKKDKSFLWLARKMDEDTTRRVERLKNDSRLEEFGVLTETKRYYPSGHIASHIIGYTNIDDEGLDGIELFYNDYMKGKVKKVHLNRDARGQSLSGNDEDSIPGNSLILTIDQNIQNIVERELENAVTKWKAEAAVAIMMEPVTGEILAMANMPTYDPNVVNKSGADTRRNRAVTDVFEPGSTFKAILASAALDEKVVKTDEKFDVSKGVIKVPGGIIRDAHKHNILTFTEVIKKSSNVGSVQVGLKLGDKRFYKYIKNFGFGEKTGVDLPGEVRGIIRDTGRWSGRSLASISIGQEVAVTPLQILRAYCAIANGGKLMRPYVVSEIISPEGEIIKEFSPVAERRVVSEDTARILRDILKTVVEEGGTARSAYIMGNLVAGKTGTAQVIDPETGGYSRNNFVSSFVGFIPADNPRLALVVIVYSPRGARYGGTVAAPVFKNIIEQTLIYLNIPMEMEKEQVILVRNTE